MATRYRREFLIRRATGRCEYCHTPLPYLSLGLHVDHILARQHGGGNDEDNLAMACAHCNACKGPNIASIDPWTRKVVWLFNPRKDLWLDHFVLVDADIRGITPVGRATVNLLGMNSRRMRARRKALLKLGVSFE